MVFDDDLRIHPLRRASIPFVADGLEVSGKSCPIEGLNPIRFTRLVWNEEETPLGISFLRQSRGHQGQGFHEGAPWYFGLAVNLGDVLWKQRGQKVDHESSAFNPRMKAVEPGSESSVNDCGEGKWIQLRTETVDGSSTDGPGLKPIMFLKNVRSHHGE